jgi:hypothetical protein
MMLWMEVFSTIEIIFVVKNNFQAPLLPPKVPSPEEAEDGLAAAIYHPVVSL